MGAFRDRTGETYGRWTVLARAKSLPDGAACWLCRCVCGAERVVTGRDLYTGRTQSCGCLRNERIAEWAAQRIKKVKLSGRPSRWRRMAPVVAVRVVQRVRQKAERDAAIVALAKQGLRRDEIAKKMQVSRNTVHGAVWRARNRGELITPTAKA